MAKQPNQKALTKKHLARLEKERRQQRNLVIGSIVVIVVVAALIIYGILDQTILKAQRPVAKVGNQNITTASFQKEVRFQRQQDIQQLTQYMSDPFIMQVYGSYITQLGSQLQDTNTLGQNVLNSMVEDSVIAQEAKKMGITVTDAEVDKAFQQAFGYTPNGTPTPTITSTPYNTPTLSSLQKTLVPPTSTPTITPVPSQTATPTGTPPTPTVTATVAATATSTLSVTETPSATPTITQTPTPLTQAGYENRVATFAANLKPIGYSTADLRDLIRRQLLRQKVTAAVESKVATIADQVWARHILVATEADAKKVEDELKAGGNFADLAKKYSTDTSTKDQGGDLGWFTRDAMVKEFSDAAFAMKVGEISQPVKSTYGYHVIQVLGHETLPLSDTQLQNAKQQAYTTWLDNAKTELKAQTFDTTWMSVVPTDPAIPANVQTQLDQLNAQQQQQQQQQQQLLPTSAPTP